MASLREDNLRYFCLHPVHAPFPATRLRRTRVSPAMRPLLRQNALEVGDLIWPIFVRAGEGIVEPVPSMPGVMRRSVDKVLEAAAEADALGIGAICVFPYTGLEDRTEDCAGAWDPQNPANRAIAAIKQAYPHIAVMSDVALDTYNINGHDGFVEDGIIVNDRTVEALVKMALSQAEAGADIIAPSDMMDGRVGAIRRALDAHDYQDVSILSYAAKYASCFYGPFRDAVGSGDALKGDKKNYQLNPTNSDEALREVSLDSGEGADMIMVKPGMSSLDIIQRVKSTFSVPTFAYQVSVEYAMIRLAAKNGALDYDAALLESLIAFKRAGCTGILTYGALDAARLILNK